MGIEIRHPGLTTPILVPFGPRNQLSADTVAQYIENALMSNNNFRLDDQMRWKFTFVEDVVGAGLDGDFLSDYFLSLIHI